MSAELASLRAYVTDDAGRRGLNQAVSTVRLNVEHASLKARFVELRLDKHVRFFFPSLCCVVACSFSWARGRARRIATYPPLCGRAGGAWQEGRAGWRGAVLGGGRGRGGRFGFNAPLPPRSQPLSRALLSLSLSQMTIAALKLKLATHTGTSAEDMALTLSDGAGGAPAIPLTDPARPLGFYSPEDGATLRVTDTNPHSLAATGWLEDTSKVEKYVMSDAEYAGREGTYRAYKEERRKVRGEKKKKKKRER